MTDRKRQLRDLIDGLHGVREHELLEIAAILNATASEDLRDLSQTLAHIMVMCVDGIRM